MSPDCLVAQATSAREIADLLARYEAAMSDARLADQSVDGRYVDAYTAGFLLAKVVVRACGYRLKGAENHRDTFAALPWLMGSDVQPDADGLDAARKKRNADLYDGLGMVDEEDVASLLRRVVAFEERVRAWLAQQHPDLTEAAP